MSPTRTAHTSRRARSTFRDRRNVPVCFTYLTRSAARIPAPATIRVCGAPHRSDVSSSFSPSPAKASRKPGRFSSDRGCCHDVLSRMALASGPPGIDRQRLAFHQSQNLRVAMRGEIGSPEMYRSDSSTGLRSVPNRLVFWAR